MCKSIKVIALLLVLALGGLGCQPAPQTKVCTAHGDCSTNQRCQSGVCVTKTVSAQCQKDSDCKTEEACDKGKCIPKTRECSADADCPKEARSCQQLGNDCGQLSGVSHCVKGVCQQAAMSIVKGASCVTTEALPACVVKSSPCSKDADCKADQFCSSGACKPKAVPECSPTKACPANARCVDSHCHPGCRSDVDCKAKQICEGGRCVPKPGQCKTDADCPTREPGCQQLGDDCSYSKKSYACSGGSCVPQQRVVVTKNATCTSDDASGARCTPSATRCVSNGDCKGNETCQSGRCLPTAPPCQTDSDCSPGEECAQGVCEKKGPECGPNIPACPHSPCINGKCTTRCSKDSECLPDGRCEAGLCVLGARCKVDKDCPAQPPRCQQLVRDCRQIEPPICHKGSCLSLASKHIMKNARCVVTPSGGTCIPATPECVTHADCPSNRICEKGICKHPTTSCTQDSDCSVQEHCQAGTCVPGVPCASDADCQAPETCLGGFCD